jgi:hypothetical protein
MNTYPMETLEYQEVIVTVGDAEVASGLKFALTPDGERPTEWLDPVILDNKPCVVINSLTPGVWQVWAQVTATPEIPVIRCGKITIS